VRFSDISLGTPLRAWNEHRALVPQTQLLATSTRKRVWGSGKQSALPTSPHPRQRLLDLKRSDSKPTCQQIQKIGQSNKPANRLPVLKAAAEVGALGKVKIITTDLFPEMIPTIESKHVLASLYQCSFVQGKTAFEVLCRYMSVGLAPTHVNQMAPHNILLSNLSLFIDHHRKLK
jgi:hypothetical protein